MLLVEEHAHHALQVADTLAFMELGTVVWSGPREQADMEVLSAAYLGGSAALASNDSKGLIPTHSSRW